MLISNAAPARRSPEVGWKARALRELEAARSRTLGMLAGLPEAELTLAHATLYIATTPKSNSATLALAEAHRVLKEQPVQTIPSSLRSKSGQANKRMGQGKGYKYSHDFPENISGDLYLEKPVTLYTPKTAGWEAKIADRLARWRELRDRMK